MRSLRSIRGLGLAGLCLPVMLAGCGKQPHDADSAPPVVAPPATSASAKAAPPPAVPGVSLENTHWHLVQVAGQPPAITPADRTEPYFILMSDGRQMQGFGGCNRMGGPYETDGSSLRFGAVHSTKMACTDPRNPEAGFMQALEATAGTRITDDKLELLDATGAALATFQARVNPAG